MTDKNGDKTRRGRPPTRTSGARVLATCVEALSTLGRVEQGAVLAGLQAYLAASGPAAPGAPQPARRGLPRRPLDLAPQPALVGLEPPADPLSHFEAGPFADLLEPPTKRGMATVRVPEPSPGEADEVPE